MKQIAPVVASCLLLTIPGAIRMANEGGAAFASSGLPHQSSTPPSPFFQQLWKEEINEPAVRLAVGDTTGDGKPRLVLLAEKPGTPGAATLLVKRWNGTEFATEFSSAVEAAPDKLAVGKFAGDAKPAVIVTADALWAWNGSTYARKPARTPLSIFGAAKLSGGDERLILTDGGAGFKAYSVNLESAESWLSAPQAAPGATQVNWESMRSAPEFFRKMGLPSVLSSGGLITVWATNRTRPDVPYIYCCRPAVQLDASGAAGRTDSYIGFRNAKEIGGNELWNTGRLYGLATDMALEDVKSPGKRGLLILTNASASGKQRTLYFYGLN